MKNSSAISLKDFTTYNDQRCIGDLSEDELKIFSLKLSKTILKALLPKRNDNT